MATNFGDFVRQTREELRASDAAYSVRRVAGQLGIQPSYLSKVERGEVAPPSEDTIIKLAGALRVDADVLLALAGKVSLELRQVILKRPQLFAQLLRQMRDAPDHAVLRLVREVQDGEW
ncbi:MAG: helix-turn-helix transcriptional regulator [Spirochaetales bacterium]